jgi:UDP-N-acetylmuramoylalanine--D-glutamate ligase
VVEAVTWSGRRVLVAGVGVSGSAVARALLELGADVVVVDAGDTARQQPAAERLRSLGAEVRLGDDTTPVACEVVVATPGMRPDHPLFTAARAAGSEVIGEPELAWRLRGADAAPWVGVTGTNGKTTTVGMLEAILRAAGLRAVAAGNVGLPLVEAVRTQPAYDVLAVEMSSQQLAWSPSVHFLAGALLNVAEDHLDWHDTMEHYVAAKRRIWAADVAIGNADDATVATMLPAHGRTFSLSDPTADFALVDGNLVDTRAGTVLLRAEELQVRGPHNVANALAAAALARAAGVGTAAVHDALAAFAPGRHRNELVATVSGVDYVDDSKATNPHAAAASLAAYQHVVWIAGGLLKGADVSDLVRANSGRLRGVVLIGRDRAAIADALARHAPDVPVVDLGATDTGVMDLAVRHAATLARPGDTVLLAPTAASWDIFRDYAQRGDLFAASARALGSDAAGPDSSGSDVAGSGT